MSYQVLARKWRPRFFSELAGQEHVLKALVNALDHGRLHHAYLFTGTRGVGKTTIARILAKCLNCEEGVSSTPCGQCASCREIDEGRFVDLIEVDAASRTKVEDTRELLDNVQYAPTRGRYKVYLIDEVHMLSGHSFNALLKTLEEPPPHVKFLLATTDPQKLPVTILSRCLQFGLKNMTPERTVDYLSMVLKKEKVPFELPALWQLARAADGSMRDALSLTDQAISFGEGKVGDTDVNLMLGTVDRGQVMRMVHALATGQAEQVLQTVSQLAEHTPDFNSVLNDLLSILHRIAIAQAVPQSVDNSQGDKEVITVLAQKMTAEDVQLYYQVGLIGKKDLQLAPDLRAGFEMALLRMLAFKPEPVLLSEADNEVELVDAEVAASVPSNDLSSISPVSVQETSLESAETSYENKGYEDKTASADDCVENSYIDTPVVDPVPAMELGKNGLNPGEKSSEHELSDIPSELLSSEEEDSVPEAAEQKKNYKSCGKELTATEYSSDGRGKLQTFDDSRCLLTEAVVLEELDDRSWISVCRQLAMGGVTGTLVFHCELISCRQDSLVLQLDKRRSTLYNETHRKRIEDALSAYFNRSLSVAISAGKLQGESPAEWRRRKAEERLQCAREAIYGDDKVSQLMECFSATIVEQSIQPVNEQG
ncbi:DNA polymerase III subunit tau [invertebrate metagenome]|uniref:DNA-directed DNA polymerase n=1 Tax=invertebrate metagenome TaxID=1711999 RepID=A0A2H9T7L0_9ZZZZ